jgi:L-rhamnose-H+ transport protein
MNTAYLIGFAWILVAGVGQGAYALPMKYTRAWKWEHLWFWYSVIALIILPILAAFLTVPHLAEIFSVVPQSQIIQTALLGLVWGAGVIFCGLGIDALGMALGFSLMTALYTALGAFIPLVALTPELVFRRSGLMVIAGNIVMAAGVVVCSIAGERRDKIIGSKAAIGRIGPNRSFRMGLIICILCGIFSPAFNFGYAFGSGITKAAELLGASKDNAVNAIWVILLPAGGLLNIAYCLYLLRKNKSWSPLIRRASWVDWLGASIMGTVWTGSVIIYGWGANDLGRLGPSLGWSLWNVILIVTTFICGLLTHEWDGVHGPPLRLFYIGISLLAAAMFVLGLGI